jgi:CHAT domain-containing protein
VGIIPHDLLHYLPFGLLYDGEYILLEGYTLFYAPSVSSLRFIFEKRHPQPNTILVLANPDAPPAPHLRHAVEEAQVVATLYNAQPFIGSDATEGYFKAQAGAYSLVHIAAHSDFEPQSPLFSAILLSGDESEDGRLETHEVFNLDLPQTDLVVLSACETHLGELSVGDEMVGLERAFIRAGSPSLLTTLWPVDDAATAALMEQFYTHLRAGVSKAEALRLAQLKTRTEHPHPYYWAGFVLVGDAGPSFEAKLTTRPTSTQANVTSQHLPVEATSRPQSTLIESKRDNTLFIGAAVLLVSVVGIIVWRHRQRDLGRKRAE